MAAETTTKPGAGDTKKKDHPEGPRDTTREIFETVVFVVVLVLLLKLFVAEAFVIPTGSMASSLYGDQVRCTCRECGHKFPINAMDNNRRMEIREYLCENCGIRISDRDVSNDISSVSSGDRVLVAKYAYHLREPRRFDVPVFKYPVEPYAARELQGMNYIKRLVGLGGETVAVFAGDLYTSRHVNYGGVPADRRPPSDKDAWQFAYMYANYQEALDLFAERGFDIVRKSPDQILAMRRSVFDLDQQPKSLEEKSKRRMRWHPIPEAGTGWSMDATGFRHSGGEGWMRYQHINPWRNDEQAYFIVDHIGYNNRGDSYNDPFPSEGSNEAWVVDHNRWVSDLILDCTIEIPSPESVVILELNKGPVRCQAIFSRGECRLVRHVTDGPKEQPVETTFEMGTQPTKIKSGGKYAIRFANVDCRLTVWVDKKVVPFSSEQSDYLPPNPKLPFAPTMRDKLQPVVIGAVGDVTVSKVSLWRDLHYNCAWNPNVREHDLHPLEPKPRSLPACDYVQTYYVQPGHFMMFGDNTNSSKDSRSWGLVPERLMLGRAVLVYYPFARMGVIE